jgi:hypothetical protein
MIQPNFTAGSVYLLAFVLTLCAAGLAHLLKRIKPINIPSGIMSPMGSIYALTAAFLLSNAFLNVSNLKTSITQEVVTINKLGGLVSALPDLQRVEARRLIYDYGYSIANDESVTIQQGMASDKSLLALQRVKDFFESPDANPPQGKKESVLTSNYSKKVTDLLYDLIDARERRIAQAKPGFTQALALALGLMYFALCTTIFVVTTKPWDLFVAGLLLMIAAPVPCQLLILFSNHFSSGIINIKDIFDALLERSL